MLGFRSGCFGALNTFRKAEAVKCFGGRTFYDIISVNNADVPRQHFLSVLSLYTPSAAVTIDSGMKPSPILLRTIGSIISVVATSISGPIGIPSSLKSLSRNERVAVPLHSVTKRYSARLQNKSVFPANSLNFSHPISTS